MLKTYISIKGCYFATDIVVNGAVIARIAFEGGVRYPKPVNGIFVTKDPTLQKAIEADKSFNVLFKLLRSEGKAEVKADINGETEFPEIVTVASARAFLLENYEKKVMNRAEVFAVAAELEITFPNLPLE